MAKTYRAASRDHRAKVAVSLTATNRRTRSEALPLGCEMQASCNRPAAVISIRGVPPMLWPTICDYHRSLVA